MKMKLTQKKISKKCNYNKKSQIEQNLMLSDQKIIFQLAFFNFFLLDQSS